MATIEQVRLRSARHAAARLVHHTQEHQQFASPDDAERDQAEAVQDALLVADELDRLADLRADLRLRLTERMVEGGFTATTHNVDWLLRKVAADLGLA